jgi:hypothetical protein
MKYVNYVDMLLGRIPPKKLLLATAMVAALAGSANAGNNEMFYLGDWCQYTTYSKANEFYFDRGERACPAENKFTITPRGWTQPEADCRFTAIHLGKTEPYATKCEWVPSVTISAQCSGEGDGHFRITATLHVAKGGPIVITYKE